MLKSVSVFARFDLEVNTQPSAQALRDLDEVALFNELQDEISLRPSPDRKGYGFVHSTHLVSLYDAGYYSYLRYVPGRPLEDGYG